MNHLPYWRTVTVIWSSPGYFSSLFPNFPLGWYLSSDLALMNRTVVCFWPRIWIVILRGLRANPLSTSHSVWSSRSSALSSIYSSLLTILTKLKEKPELLFQTGDDLVLGFCCSIILSPVEERTGAMWSWIPEWIMAERGNITTTAPATMDCVWSYILSHRRHVFLHFTKNKHKVYLSNHS